MREAEEISSQASMSIHSERNSFPRRIVQPPGKRRLLSGGQAEKGSEDLWHPEQDDGELVSRWGPAIACQPFVPAEAIMRPLCSGKDRRLWVWSALAGRADLDFQPVVAHELHAGTAMLAATPVSPE
jgi:hypothetical protein